MIANLLRYIAAPHPVAARSVVTREQSRAIRTYRTWGDKNVGIMLEVMRQDYIRTAWSKGLRERGVILQHALKNGLIPIITLIGMGVPMIIGGAVLEETVFNIPGMGVLAVNSVFNQDYPYVQGIVLIVSVTVLVTNLLVELAYGWLDPRIRFD